MANDSGPLNAEGKQAASTSREDAIKPAAEQELADANSELVCPFCGHNPKEGEGSVCATCGLELERRELPIAMSCSQPPATEPNPWTEFPVYYPGRGRGFLAVGAILGFCLFFAPWVDMLAPEIMVMSGYRMAQNIPWLWACLASWLTLFGIVVVRRSVIAMRTARVIASVFCGIPLVSTIVILSSPPKHASIPVRFDFTWGLYATLVIACLSLPAAFLFGGAAPVQSEPGDS